MTFVTHCHLVRSNADGGRGTCHALHESVASDDKEHSANNSCKEENINLRELRLRVVVSERTYQSYKNTLLRRQLTRTGASSLPHFRVYMRLLGLPQMHTLGSNISITGAARGKKLTY
jgi:hypothetical protein